MTTEFQQVLESIADLRTDLTAKIQDSETRLEAKIRDSETRLEAKIQDSETRLDAKIESYKLDTKMFNTKFDYYQQATQWVIILAFSLILAATAITIFSTVFTFR
jgi:hypothetical protein